MSYVNNISNFLRKETIQKSEQRGKEVEYMKEATKWSYRQALLLFDKFQTKMYNKAFFLTKKKVKRKQTRKKLGI